jgi:hypothetical protein
LEKIKFDIEILFSEPALMGHVEPEQDYYYDSEDFNDEDDYAPTSKKSKVSSRLLPCPSLGPKMFCAGPKFFNQSKNLTSFSASSKTFVSAQKRNLLNGNRLFCNWYKMYTNF